VDSGTVIAEVCLGGTVHSRLALSIALVIAVSASDPSAAPRGARPQPRTPPRPSKLDTIAVDAATRLLIIAPHPDDEVLAAGGLIQHVRAVNGAVRVVYFTSGEGYPEGVRAEEGVARPTVADYRAYGQRREREARGAMRELGVTQESLTFLGFPNGGLHRLMTRYWSERRSAYRSPYTRLDRPRPSEVVVADTEFRGEDLTQELAMLIGAFKPTLIIVPRKEDQHVDHCAAWFFTADALTDVERVDHTFQTELLTYMIHFESWPFEDEDPTIEPPEGIGPARSQWRSVVLTDRELKRKRAAIERYKSQMKVMDWFLMGFARRNELFARPSSSRVVLPVRRSPCDDFIETPASRK